MQRETAAAAVIIVAMSAQTLAADSGREAMLRQLDPTTRLEQLCTLEAMERIARAPNPYKPERAVAEASAPTVAVDHKLRGPGGAFRSKGRWYALAFDCEATPDHMKVISLSYRIGSPIPKDKWESYGLWR